MLITTYLTKYELDEKVDDNKKKRNTTTIDIESYVTEIDRYSTVQ